MLVILRQLFWLSIKPPKLPVMHEISAGFYIDDFIAKDPLSTIIMNALHDQSIYQQKTMWVRE